MSKDVSNLGLAELAAEVEGCCACPRLLAWREQAAADPPRRFHGEPYWGRPVAGFGDPSARLVVVGLAQAAHGGNRTGRIFTGQNTFTGRLTEEMTDEVLRRAKRLSKG